jgi:hypothetical protein
MMTKIIAHNDFAPFILPMKDGLLPLTMIFITLKFKDNADINGNTHPILLKHIYSDKTYKKETINP